jgi:tetratricopeptide (TPR) repeat protein
MKRWLLAAVLGVLVIGVLRADDDIFFMDHATKKVDSVRGKIQDENASGITIKVKKETKKIPAADIVRVVYGVPGLTISEFNRPYNTEEKAFKETKAQKRAELIEKATGEYQTNEKEARGNSNAVRYIQYRLANLKVRQAHEDPMKIDLAIEALTAYKSANPIGWEIGIVLRDLARLQEAAGKMDEARKTYEELADTPDLPREVKVQYEFLVSRMLLRASKYADAERRLRSVDATLPPKDPQRPFVAVYLADSQLNQGNAKAAEDQLLKSLKENNDPKLRGVIHNLLGDCARKKGQDADAFWHYLRVDALYNDDPEEQAKALFYLRTLFDKVKSDPGRARDCANRLKDERFANTTYQRLADSDKK